MKASVILVLVVAGLTVAKSVGTTLRSMGQVEQPVTSGLAFLDPGGRILSVKCIYRAHGITPGQTYVGLVCGDNVLEVVAGRENSPIVAAGFEQGIDADKMFTTSDCCCQGSPKELNFYVEVNITFTMGSEDMGTHTLRFGQGHYGGWSPDNNWWVGGTLCQHSPCGIICINEENQKVALSWNADLNQVGVEF
jgi:hypothetical protein